MSVARDDEPDPSIAGTFRMHVVQIEAMGLTIDFERDVSRARRIDHRVDVECVRFSPENRATGWMTENVDMRVVDRAEEPIGHLLRVLAEGRVY